MAGFPIHKTSGYRVVVDCASEQPEQWEVALDQIEALLQSLGPKTEIALVACGPGIHYLCQLPASIAQRIARLVERRVAFLACRQTLQRLNLSQEQLAPGIGTVDSGMAELVRRQTLGWSYLRAR